MNALKRFQRTAYLASRTAGDLDAARRGVEPLARRVIRRRLTRFGFGLFRNGAR